MRRGIEKQKRNLFWVAKCIKENYAQGMTKIHEPSELRFSREAVFQAYRDHLPELVKYFPNVERIEVKNRTDEGKISRLENHWYADAPIPKIAQSIIKPEMLRWIDRAEWDENAFTCKWSIETYFLSESIICEGLNHFDKIDDNTMRLTVDGDLTISSVPGVPKMFQNKIAEQVEKFAVKLITPNFEHVNKGIVKYLESKGSQAA